MTTPLQGAFTAIITPFKDGRVDDARLTAQIEFQIQSGINGLVPVGTTGESPTLDFDEHFHVIEHTIKTAGGRVPVIAGVGGNATAEALKLHKFAHSVGATAGLSVNPYYNKPNQEGLYQHFMHLSDNCPLPIVLYNIPGRCGINMTPATVARLAKNANVIAIKEAAGSCDQVSEIKLACDLPILSGDDSLTLPFMSVGAVGVVSVVSNLVPGEIAKLCRLAFEQNFADARVIHYRFFELIKSIFLDGNPGGVKHAMKLLERDSGEVRLPVAAVNELAARQIEQALRQTGLLK